MRRRSDEGDCHPQEETAIHLRSGVLSQSDCCVYTMVKRIS